MKAIILAILLVLPNFLLASPKAHRVRLVLNVVDDGNGIVNLQDTRIGNRMFVKLIEGDKNLEFLTDIGFKYIKSIMVEMSNDTQNKNQQVVVRTLDDRVVIKEIPFFVYYEPQPTRYVFTADRFIAKKTDRDVYYLAAYSY